MSIGSLQNIPDRLPHDYESNHALRVTAWEKDQDTEIVKFGLIAKGFELSTDTPLTRPVVFEYSTPQDFLKDLYSFYKKQGYFSLRQRAARTGTLSQGLISQIMNGRRKLTRGNLPGISLIFKLTKYEQEYLDKQLLALKIPEHQRPIPVQPILNRETKNHILNDWLHPYVKDLAHLKGFVGQPATIHRMLGGIASPQRIQRSIDFLEREGFWRRNSQGEFEPQDPSVITTHEIPSQSIRQFHRHALEVARKGLMSLPVEKRKASTILISVNPEQLNELKDMVESFQNQLIEFIERHPKGSAQLVQVAMHLTPIGGLHE